MASEAGFGNRDEQVRIVVVEDDVRDQELLFHRLRECQMDQHLKFFTSGTAALQFLSGANGRKVAGQLAAIFLDLNLPGISGLELLRTLRRQSDLSNVPAIVITGSDDPADLEECRRLGVAHYISKPITFAAFAKAIADTFQPSVKAVGGTRLASQPD